MKKLFILLTALLTLGAGGAWAYEVNTSEGTFYNDAGVSGVEWAKTFKSSDNKITIVFAQGFGTTNTELYAPTDASEGTYTITYTGFGTITNYAISGIVTGDLTFTPDGGSAQMVANGNNANWSETVNAKSTTFKLQGGHITGVTFTITTQEEETVTLSSGFSGTFYSSNFYYANGTQEKSHSDWVAKCITNTTVPITLDFGADQSLSDWNCYINVGDSKVLTVSLPDGYVIKNYSFTGTVVDNYTVTVAPKNDTPVSFPYNTSATVSASNVNKQSTSIRFNSNTSNQCRVNVTDFSITIIPNEDVISEGVYRIRYSKNNNCYVKSDFTVAKGKTGATADDGGDFLFTKVSGTTNTYYIRTLTDGGYLYAAGVGNVTGSSPYQYDNAAAVSNNTSFDSSDDKFKWILAETSTGSGKYYIRPKSNTNTAIAMTSDNNEYLAFYDKTGGYDFAWAILTPRILDDVVSKYPVKFLNLEYDLEDIKVKMSYSKYVMSSSDQETYLDEIGFPTTEAYTAFTTTFTSTGTLTAKAAIDGLLASTVPTSGYYYIKNKQQSTYMFRDENYDTYTADMTLLNTESKTSKYIWKVDITADGTTANVTSLTGKSITGKDASPFARKDMDITSAWLMNFPTGYGAYFMGCLQDPVQNGSFTAKGSGDYDSATNPRKVAYWDGDRNNTKAYWIFEPVDASEYDVYSVTIEDAPNNNYVLYTGSATTGNMKVYDGGYYFMTKDASVSVSDFTPQAVDGYGSSVSITDKTIIVTYWSWEERINSYVTAHDVWTKLTNAGKVGYPANTPANTGDLTTVKQLIESADYTKDTYDLLTGSYEAYIEAATTGIVLPEEGKTYTIANYAKNGTLRYLYNNNGTIDLTTTSSSADKFVCHIKDGKFIFAMNNGKYLIWKGNGTTNGLNDGSGQAALSQMIENENYPLTIQKFSHSNATSDVAFGKLQIIGLRTAPSTNSSFIVRTSANPVVFDQANTSNFFDTNYSSAWIITEADYYNKVILTSDGENAYASVYLPFSVTIPSGIKAFAVESQDGTNAMMTEIVGADKGTLPANTAAILKKYDQDSNETLYLSPAEEAGSYSGENRLAGTLDTKTRASLGTGTTYVLAKDANGLGLHNYTGENLAKGKAYLFVSGGGAKALSFYFGDEETAINAVKADESVNADAATFDLSGRRIAQPTKGLYIREGKKILVK